MLMRRQSVRMPSALVAAGVTFVVLMAAYLGTAAPDLSFWDANELATAANVLGIPHPPGTPLWVILGRVATLVFGAAGPARSVTLLSVVATAAAGGLGAAMSTRWIGARAAVAAAVGAGAMFSVWSSATETEVYAVALFLSVSMLFAGEQAGRAERTNAQRERWRALLAFLTALSLPLHLSAVVAFPAAVALAWRGRGPTTAEALRWVALALLGASAIAIVPLRAAYDPALNSGHAVTLDALSALLRREQYAVAGLWPRAAPLWLQIGNVFEWADWQVAYGIHPYPQPAWLRTSLSVLWAWLSVLGLRRLWRHDVRVGRAMLVLLLSGTIGVAFWLNLKAGPSYGAGVLPVGALHEARERDYFFALGFWCWGMMAGAGLGAIAERLSRGLPGFITPVVLTVAAVPLLLNAPVMDRRREPAASMPRVFGRLLLDAVPNGGVLLTAGDNDSFPLWYLQHVEGYRTDVAVVTVPLLGARWYREELEQRYHLLDRDANPAEGLASMLQRIDRQGASSGRPLRVSALLSGETRRLINPGVGWRLEGLVYAADSAIPVGSVALDLPRLRMASERIPPYLLEPLLPGADAAALQMQSLLRCAGIRRRDDALLVSMCGGA